MQSRRELSSASMHEICLVGVEIIEICEETNGSKYLNSPQDFAALQPISALLCLQRVRLSILLMFTKSFLIMFYCDCFIDLSQVFAVI